MNAALTEAEPLVLQAFEPLMDISEELKTHKKPSAKVKDTMADELYMTSRPGKLCSDTSWKAARNMLAGHEFVDFKLRFSDMCMGSIPCDNTDAANNAPAANKLDPKAVKRESKAAGALTTRARTLTQYDATCQMLMSLQSFYDETINTKLLTAEKEAGIAKSDSLTQTWTWEDHHGQARGRGRGSGSEPHRTLTEPAEAGPIQIRTPSARTDPNPDPGCRSRPESEPQVPQRRWLDRHRIRTTGYILFTL